MGIWVVDCHYRLWQGTNQHLIFTCTKVSARHTSRTLKALSFPYKLQIFKVWTLGVNISSLGSSLKHLSHFWTTLKCQERWSIKHYLPTSDPSVMGYSSTGHPLIFDQLNCKPAGIQNMCNCQTWDLGRGTLFRWTLWPQVYCFPFEVGCHPFG